MSDFNFNEFEKDITRAYDLYVKASDVGYRLETLSGVGVDYRAITELLEEIYYSMLDYIEDKHSLPPSDAAWLCLTVMRGEKYNHPYLDPHDRKVTCLVGSLEDYATKVLGKAIDRT